MPDEAFLLRQATAADWPALAPVDASFSDEWELHVERGGSAIEQQIALCWRRTKPAGSRRAPPLDEEAFHRADTVLLAERDGRVAGYVMLMTQWNRTAEIVAIAVDAACRRGGLGRRFVEAAEAFARERSLRAVQWEAQTDNRDAIEFALAQGFRIAGLHDALYRNDDLSRQETADFRGIALFLTKALA